MKHIPKENMRSCTLNTYKCDRSISNHEVIENYIHYEMPSRLILNNPQHHAGPYYVTIFNVTLLEKSKVGMTLTRIPTRTLLK